MKTTAIDVSYTYRSTRILEQTKIVYRINSASIKHSMFSPTQHSSRYKRTYNQPMIELGAHQSNARHSIICRLTFFSRNIFLISSINYET